ncbi:MAG: hydroxymethylbilane synthase [Desulfofustis sp. PB-SRB1]|mgnify:CR=1 FL=1|jgi:hydroxymethylbilane synthase|nr:hydroxymethylbilane synthase [Desulfofustis sp. PB-SRB1]MBM1001025.1 hydroxymethylbilane synthase [Desulfofustis sp. PB-SRB1]HBH27692.1 hydroxymethylbilane synthase [Desulfofustis sp.]HBH32573.1 hydroxymethylbilane synthase [Desulfofustis sp.]
MTTIRIGSRKSKLAMWQSEFVAGLLNEQGVDTVIDAIETRGDQILDRSIAKIGSKGVFTEELEEQLAGGVTDIAVHSAKDMQSQLPEGFELIAFSLREQCHDVLVGSETGGRVDLAARPMRIGTSSVRRAALLKRVYPHIEVTPMRGNLQTRLAKLEAGDCDALMLAYAGVKRMGFEHRIVHEFAVEQFVPPVGQGCIAVEAATSLPEHKRALIRDIVNDGDSEYCLLAERAFLGRLQGGCSIPVFGHATLDGDILTLVAGLTNLDGSWMMVETVRGKKDEAVSMGTAMGEKILTGGGREVLAAIRGAQQAPEA